VVGAEKHRLLGAAAPAAEGAREIAQADVLVDAPGELARIAALGVQRMPDTGPAGTQAFVAREVERWAPIVRASGATPS
jgi:hypothetical protein